MFTGFKNEQPSSNLIERKKKTTKLANNQKAKFIFVRKE